MSFLSALPIIGDIIKGATGIIEKSVTDKDAKIAIEAKLEQIRLEAENQLLQFEHEAKVAQIGVNKEEAKSDSLFVAGWRPAVGWTCGIAMAFNFVLLPILPWIISIISIWVPEAGKVELPEPFDLGQMLPVLLGMLGIGGYRSFEKVKGVNNK